jgi:diaminohydroxyphosphoribosylaminopyrimidine deaminase/5-amino-6-(5-phosphoribosylamino)uracil reductase
VDSKLKDQITGKIMKDPSRVIIATTSRAHKKSIENLKKRGVRVVITKPDRGLVNMKELMRNLGSMGIMNLLIEGGAKINSSVLKDNLVDKMLIFTAPKIIGKGKASIGNLGITKVDKAINLKNSKITSIGKDVLVEGYL